MSVRECQTQDRSSSTYSKFVGSIEIRGINWRKWYIMTGKLDVWLDVDAIFWLMLEQYNLVITITALGGLLSCGSRYIPHTTSGFSGSDQRICWDSRKRESPVWGGMICKPWSKPKLRGKFIWSLYCSVNL